MAKNYQRHSQGRRFESKNFGDMGLRAYREQQQTIINAMKLHATQYKDVHDEYLSGTVDKARKEREHRKVLKALEDDVWDNKQLNKKIRADREIDQLRASAEDHEKSAKFWQNFSTTYAKQYGEAFETISSALDLKYAEKIHAQNKEVGEDGQTKYDRAIGNSKVLNNIANSGLINTLDDTYTDPKNNGHYKRNENAHALDIKKRSSHQYNIITANELIEDSEKIVTHLRDTLGSFDPKNPEKGIKITKHNIQGIVQRRSLEIIANLGMDPNSEGGQKFLDHMWKVAKEEFEKERDLAKVAEDENNMTGNDGLLATAKATVGGKHPIEWEINLNHMIKYHQNHWGKDDSGKPVFITMDVKEATIATYEKLISEGIIDKSNMNQLNIPYPGQPIPAKVIAGVAEDKRKLMWARHPDLVETIELAIVKKEKQNQANKTVKDETEDQAGLAKVKAGFADGTIDPNNLDQLNALGQGYRDNPKTKKFIDEAKVFNPTNNGTDGFLVNARINTAYGSNDYEAYVHTMQFAGQDVRKAFDKFTRHLDSLNRSGGSNKEIKEQMEKHVNADLKLSALNDAEDNSVSSMVDVMIQDFYFEYRKVANREDLNGEGKVDAALAAVFKKYEDGKGMYRKENSGKSTIFPAMKGKYEPRQALTLEQLEKKLSEPGVSFDNLFATVEATNNDENQADLNLMDQDWVDSSLRSVINGNPITSNETLDYLYYIQPVGDKMLSKTEIFNKYLKAKGIKTQVPVGAIEHVDAAAKNIITNIGNYYRMSPENKARAVIMLKTIEENGGKMPIAKDVRVQETNTKVRQNFKLEPQYSKKEVKNMNKSNKPWWYNPALFGDHYNKNK